jgi:DNA invertase Pin-like site-specific DNA recombinase
VDAVGIGLFEEQLKDNLYKLWNRMSSGCYFPGPVRGVEIPKDNGKAVAREGFTELVTRVCSGDVGAIFGIEITRLARSNAGVARLAEFAAITGTLLIDPDGVYDPADVNDRVLLGFKGTMGEMELHVMAQRLHANKRAAAERGELRTPLPAGLVHDETGGTVIDPDAEVQAAIADVFAAFTACGSAYGVVAAFAGRRFPLRAYGGAWAGQPRGGNSPAPA